MGTRWIRQASDTPNVSNTDDVRMIRYAYGYQDGILKNVGAQVAASASGSTFKLASGVIVLQGWELEIDANGWSMTVDNVATTRRYVVYFEVNLAAQTAEIKSVYSTVLPLVKPGEDLSANTTGTARLLLYSFSATSGVITEIVRAAKIVEPWTGAGFAKKSDLTSGAYAVAQANVSDYASRSGYASSAGSAVNSTYTKYLSQDSEKRISASISSGKATFNVSAGWYFYNIILVISSARVAFSGAVKIGPYLKGGYDILCARIPIAYLYNTCYGDFESDGKGNVTFSLKNRAVNATQDLQLSGSIDMIKFAETSYV